jgi:hypothetical protein
MSGLAPQNVLIEEDIRRPIQPHSIVSTKTINSFTIRVLALELFKSVTIIASLFDANGIIVENRTIEVKDNEYLAWNNDDSYLVNLVASKLGFTMV